jgi:hypothetical protein
MRALITTNDSDSSGPAPVFPMPRVPVTLDSKGRVRVAKEQRRLILAEFESSGLSAARFAQVSGLKYSTFAGWLQRQRRTKPKGPSRPVRLLEAVVEQKPGPGGQNPAVLVLQLPGGVQLEVADERQAVLAGVLVQALAKSC